MEQIERVCQKSISWVEKPSHKYDFLKLVRSKDFDKQRELKQNQAQQELQVIKNRKNEIEKQNLTMLSYKSFKIKSLSYSNANQKKQIKILLGKRRWYLFYQNFNEAEKCEKKLKELGVHSIQDTFRFPMPKFYLKLFSLPMEICSSTFLLRTIDNKFQQPLKRKQTNSHSIQISDGQKAQVLTSPRCRQSRRSLYRSRLLFTTSQSEQRKMEKERKKKSIEQSNKSLMKHLRSLKTLPTQNMRIRASNSG